MAAVETHLAVGDPAQAMKFVHYACAKWPHSPGALLNHHLRQSHIAYQ